MKQEKLDVTRLFALAEILQHTEFRDWCGSVRACAERLSALPADDALEGLRASAIGLCAAIDNLWNHPDLVRVRSEIPESIKLNISRHQLQVRTKLAAPAQEPRS